MPSTLPPSVATILAIRSTAVPTSASSASAGRMSMHSYSLNIHLLWSGRPPHEGEQKDEGCPECTGRRLKQPVRRVEQPRRTDRARRGARTGRRSVGPVLVG